MKVFNTSNELIEWIGKHHAPMHEYGGVDIIESLGDLTLYGQLLLTPAAAADYHIKIDGTAKLNANEQALYINFPSETVATNAAWFTLGSTVTSGDLTGLRSRVTGNAASSGANVRGAYLEAKGGASKYAAMLEGSLSHADYSAGSVTVSGDVRGFTAQISQGTGLNAANLYGGLINIQTRGNESITTNDVGLMIRNEAVGGTGRQMDAAILLAEANLSGGIKSFGYGIDMNGLNFATADIRFANSETMIGLDDVPVDAASTSAISSNWASVHQTITNAPTGFPNRTDSVLSFDTITFTITPAVSTFDYYIAGVKYTKSSAENIVIADTSGAHLIYYDGSTLSESANPNTATEEDILLNKAWVATIYWQTTGTGTGVAPLLADERHGAVMSGKTHLWFHVVNGAAYGDGLTLSGYTEDTDTDAALTFELTDGHYDDEDLEHAIINGVYTTQYSQQLNSGDAVIPIIYKIAGGVWVEDTASTLPYKLISANNRLAYNSIDGSGNGSQVEVTDGKWVSMTLIATNDWQYPIKAIQGQNEYTDKKTAVEEATAEIISFGGGTLSPEVLTLYRFVLNTKDTFGGTKKAKIEVDGVTDFRTSTVIGGAAVATDHGALGGLGDDDHAQYIKDTEFTQNSGVLVGTGSGTFAEETGNTLRTSLGLAIGTDVLAFDTGLSNLAGIAMAANKFYYTSGDNVHVAGDASVAGRAVLGAATDAAILALLSGDAGAAFDWGSQNLTSVGTLNTHTIPGGTDTFALLAATQTLAAKTLTAPVIDGTVTNTGAALVMPAHSSGDISLGANKLKTTNLLIKEESADYWAIKNAADSAYKNIIAAVFYCKGEVTFEGAAQTLQAGGATGDALLFKAQDTGVGRIEVARLTGAATPTFDLLAGRLTGALDANAQALSDCGNITMNGASTVDGVDVSAHDVATTGVHGITGTIVGTTETQTLSAKTLTSPTLNGTTTLGSTPIFDAGAGSAQINTTGIFPLILQSTQDGANGCLIRADHISASPDAGNKLLILQARGKDSVGVTTEFVAMDFIMNDPTNTAEDGKLQVRMANAGSLANVALTLSGAGALWLDAGATLSGALDMGTNLINNVVDPTTDQQAATKKYVDDNAGTPTKEFFVNAQVADAGFASYIAGGTSGALLNTVNNDVFFQFHIPDDWTAITEAVIVAHWVGSYENTDLDLVAQYSAVGEDVTTHTESDAASTYSFTDKIVREIDVSGILTGIAAGDTVGVGLRLSTDPGGTLYLHYLRFKYS